MKKLLTFLLFFSFVQINGYAGLPASHADKVVMPTMACYRTNIRVCGGGTCYEYISSWYCFRSPIVVLPRVTNQESGATLTDLIIDKATQTMKLKFAGNTADSDVVINESGLANFEAGGHPSETKITSVNVLKGKYAIENGVATISVVIE